MQKFSLNLFSLFVCFQARQTTCLSRTEWLGKKLFRYSWFQEIVIVKHRFISWYRQKHKVYHCVFLALLAENHLIKVQKFK
jgi:hypothetical protein